MMHRSFAPTVRVATRQFAAFEIPLGLEHGTKNQPGQFRVKTFNKISEKGLERFPGAKYSVSAEFKEDVHAIMLRSHKLTIADVPVTTRCIARCGAGTNNIPVGDMTAAGIPVFNT